MRQDTASSDRDLGWMLLATACLSRSDGMRHTRLADLCPPAPVNGVGERLGLADGYQPHGLDSKACCAALLGVMGSWDQFSDQGIQQVCSPYVMPAACQSLAAGGCHMLPVLAGLTCAPRICSRLAWPAETAACCLCRPQSVRRPACSDDRWHDQRAGPSDVPGSHQEQGSTPLWLVSHRQTPVQAISAPKREMYRTNAATCVLPACTTSELGQRVTSCIVWPCIVWPWHQRTYTGTGSIKSCLRK